MNRILAIASETLSEVIRHRILYLLLVFAVVMILFSRTLSLMTVGEDVKIIKDVGLSAINVFGLMVTLFVGVGIIFKDMEKRTVQVTLSGPVARWEYLLGKYLGLSAAITLNTLLMTLLLYGMLFLRDAADPVLLVAVFMLWVELLFITAAAVFFSSFSTPIFSALFTAATYVVGHLAWSLTLLEARLPAGGFASAVHYLYLLVPDLEYGDLRSQAVHGVTISTQQVVFATAYELGYAGLLLAIAAFAFRRRDLV